ncbi:hypothetical protein C3747_135g3 [Trypanosoma cruzi]|uniref:Uncharacterized protein n=1 Tax=Trypanosoma cruzi TaxID=5693 RepID=A0A2V2W9H8_TRYCR|nr:hypothetical protein C3747_135g3 [Trypanosoma cruzi]
MFYGTLRAWCDPNSYIALFVVYRHGFGRIPARSCLVYGSHVCASQEFYCPLESSFLTQRRLVRLRQENDNAPENEMVEEVESVQANGRAEAITFTSLLVYLPFLLYILFQSSFIDAWLPNTLNAVGMICGPVAYICWDPKHSLWFLISKKKSLRDRIGYDPLGVQETVSMYRKPFLILSVAVSLHWSIYRLLHSRYRFFF